MVRVDSIGSHKVLSFCTISLSLSHCLLHSCTDVVNLKLWEEGRKDDETE